MILLETSVLYKSLTYLNGTVQVLQLGLPLLLLY